MVVKCKLIDINSMRYPINYIYIKHLILLVRNNRITALHSGKTWRPGWTNIIFLFMINEALYQADLLVIYFLFLARPSLGLALHCHCSRSTDGQVRSLQLILGSTITHSNCAELLAVDIDMLGDGWWEVRRNCNN